jgi:TRAP-type C4-dicarboxylate transport system permease small subunit
VKRIAYIFKNLEEIICGTFLVSMVLLVIVNVLLRFFFSYSIFWAEEVATICFVWAVFIGGAATYKNRMDIGIDILITKMPEGVQRAVRFGVDVLLLAINGYIFYMAIVFTKISFVKPTAVLGVSSAVVNSALIVGFGLITLHTIRFMIADIRKKIAGAPAYSEGGE